jgi:TolB protein
MRSDGTDVERLTYSSGRDAHPFYMPSGDRIVFQSPRHSGDEREVDLYTMDTSGRGQRRILATAGFDGVAVPSPDGRAIAFQRGVQSQSGSFHWELFLVDSVGNNERQLTRNAWSSQVPSWRPGTSELVFFANPDGREQLFTIDVGSLAARPLTTSGHNDQTPAVSPDGRWVVFTSDRDGSRDLYLFDYRSTAVSRLTKGMDVWSQPSWSRDGNKLVFSALSELGGSRPPPEGIHDIFIINRDGSGLQRLTRGLEGVR